MLSKYSVGKICSTAEHRQNQFLRTSYTGEGTLGFCSILSYVFLLKTRLYTSSPLSIEKQNSPISCNISPTAFLGKD